MDGEQEEFIFSQEAMRQQDDLVFPSYNFGSEPQNGPSQRPVDGSQRDATAASGSGGGAEDVPPGQAKANGQGSRSRKVLQHGKIFSDPVHGTFRLDPINVAVIDTPQFQRLRDLHQLGLTHLIFPGAVHTRFEHSLGTSYKALEMATRIFRTQPDLDMEKDDIRLVSLAGLCHDLGHGPFSHVFEYEFLRRKLLGEAPGSEAHLKLQNWHHETMSTRILEYLVDENNIEGIEQEDIRRISDFIKGDEHEDRGYLYDIVNNKRNGVDVDKIDYLQRDALMCDVNIGCDFKRLLTLTKVLQNQIGYKWSEYSNIWDLFHARESMHRKVYTHRKTKAVEFMVVDALLEADQALGFSDNIHSAEDFCTLNDSLLSFIENYGKLERRRGPQLDNGADRCIEKAQHIIRRLRCRDLYRFGNQFTVPFDYLENGRWETLNKEFTAQNVASCYRGCEVRLRPEDVIVSQTKIDFTAGLGNPLNNVLFWDNSDDPYGRRIEPHQVVGILPNYHQERILRVYTPNPNPAYQKAVGEALTVWCQKWFGSNAQMATPARPRYHPSLAPREAAMREADPRRGPSTARPPPVPSSGTGTVGTATTTTATTSHGNSRTAGQPVASGGGGANGGAIAAVGGGGSIPGSAAGSGHVSVGGDANGVVVVVGGGGVGGGGGGHRAVEVEAPGGGTPTRSTPHAPTATAATETVAEGTGGRAKRPRSSLFQD